MEEPRPALAFSSYGSDKDGLVCAYLFEPRQPGRAIASEDALAWLRAPEPRGSFACSPTCCATRPT